MPPEKLIEFNKELEALQLKYGVIVGVEHKIVVQPIVDSPVEKPIETPA